MHILLTNDDGIESPGLVALLRRVRSLGRVTVVAPARERSGIAHAITLSGRLSCRRLPDCDGVPCYALTGTPVDCVKFAVSTSLIGPIDLVLSGINRGANVGVSVLYSGTVSAALEAGIYGLPAAAISLAVEEGVEDDFGRAAEIALELVERLLEADLLSRAPVNINIPPLRAGWPLGWRAVEQSLTAYADRFVPSSPEGVWHLVSGETRCETNAETDLHHLQRGYVTITPLTFDLTDRPALARLRELVEPVAEEA